MIVGALIHDLGDDLAPLNHSQLAAAIIRPMCEAKSLDYRASRRFSDVLLWGRHGC